MEWIDKVIYFIWYGIMIQTFIVLILMGINL